MEVDLQHDDAYEAVPDIKLLGLWVNAALLSDIGDLEQTIRIVGEAEIQGLNSQYRGREDPTNILSFPADIPHIDYQYLGDLVICAPVVIEEAKQQGKSAIAHWAHLIVHGMLHLQGYDHESPADAKKMETLEVKILSTLGYSNPYNDD